VCTTSIPKLDLKITSTSDTTLNLTIARQNPPPNRDFRIHAPKFPKPQTEGYFVILGDEEQDEIFALKRVGWPAGGRSTSANVKLDLPPGLEVEKASVWCISDGYMGVETVANVRLGGMEVEEAWAEKERVGDGGW
jgi:antiviral helicase SLH1